MKIKLLFPFLISVLFGLFSTPSIQAQSYFTKDNWETQLGPFSTINGQWRTSNPTNNTLGVSSYQGMNFGFDINNYSSLVNPIGTDDLYFGRWSWDWKGWRKIVIADGNGYVGIGTQNPIGKFDVRGNVFIGTTDLSIGTVGSFVQIDQGSPSGNSYSQIRAYSNGGNTNNQLVLQSTGGNVGIGTTTPSARLEVMGAYNDVSLSANSNATAVFRTPGHVQMAINTQLVAPHTTSLQAKHSTFDGNSYPLALNPLGGNVGIGTTTPDEKLAVNGTIHAKEVRVDLVGWPDYVFADTYNLKPLSSIAQYIKENGHLPNVPSATEVEEKGLELSKIAKMQQEKIEELTLYLIQQNKEIEELKTQVMSLMDKKQ